MQLHWLISMYFKDAETLGRAEKSVYRIYSLLSALKTSNSSNKPTRLSAKVKTD